jgi:hypothetical protein
MIFISIVNRDYFLYNRRIAEISVDTGLGKRMVSIIGG